MNYCAPIQESAAKNVLIAAHRGVASGNVPCNSIPGYKAALNQGADIIELDISRSKDGVLYTFHPGMEPVFLGCKPLISEMESKEVDAMFLRNQDSALTPYHVPYFEDVLKLLKGKCYINIDKFWSCPDDIAKAVRAQNMQDQVLIKTSNTKEDFARVEEVAADLPYMVIAWDKDEFTEDLLQRKIRYVGVEALFSTEDVPIASEHYLASLRQKGLVAWANSIVYDYKAVLTAGHTDDLAVSEDPDAHWGWLINRGFNIIQTDWPLALGQYLKR